MIDWEFLAISYSYTNKVLDVEYVGDDPAVPALLSQIAPTSTDKEKFSVADEILKRWGMSRQ